MVPGKCDNTRDQVSIDLIFLPLTAPSLLFVYSKSIIVAYNGTKVIVFGGSDIQEISQSGIFILDVATMHWTAGTPASPSQARCNLACTVNGDHFIAWGGNACGLQCDPEEV